MATNDTLKLADPKKPGLVREYRHRMACVGKFIRELFNGNPNPDPEMLARDAYLVVVGRLVEALSSGKETLSTADLTALSKALAEQRRLDLVGTELDRKHPPKSQNEGAPSDGSTRFNSTVGTMVKQVYGTEADENPSTVMPNES